MINKKDFAKMARNIFKKGNSAKNSKLIHPTRDWLIGLLLVFLILISVGAWSASTYLSYRNIAIINEAESLEDTVVYRESMVKAALESYEERKEKHEALLANQQSRPTTPAIDQEEEGFEVETDTSSSTEDQLDDTNEETEEVLEETTETSSQDIDLNEGETQQ